MDIYFVEGEVNMCCERPNLSFLEDMIVPEKKIYKKWLRVEECVVRYGVTRTSILRWVDAIESRKKRKICVFSGRTRLIDTSQIDEFLESRQ